jgi:hypothetical protein
VSLLLGVALLGAVLAAFNPDIDARTGQTSVALGFAAVAAVATGLTALAFVGVVSLMPAQDRGGAAELSS